MHTDIWIWQKDYSYVDYQHFSSLNLHLSVGQPD